MDNQLRNFKGKRVGRLFVLEHHSEIKRTNGKRGSKHYWLCKCECGKTKVVSHSSLLRERTKSCGCFSKECWGKNIRNPKMKKYLDGLTEARLKRQVRKNCVLCGKEFLVRKRTSRFCSQECYWKARKDPRLCPKSEKFINSLRGNKRSRGHIPWNAGKTKEEHPSLMSISKKARLLTIKRLERTGNITPFVDDGAKEYFDNMNLFNNFHIIHPNYKLGELGYFLDGYDPILHAVFEYDSPHHIRKQQKDLTRQNEIINYFIQIGNPLNHFFRINRTGRGEQGMTDVLTRKDWALCQSAS